MWRKREDREQRIGTNAYIPTSRRNDDSRLGEDFHVRISNLDFRRIEKLFQRNRDLFAWEVKSDQYRDIIKIGIAHYEDRTKNPDEDMLAMKRMADTLDTAESLAARHARLDRAVAYMDEEIKTLMCNKDFAAMRTLLKKFQDETTKVKDRAIKARREVEFEARWSSLWASLNRPMSLNPKDWVEDDE